MKFHLCFLLVGIFISTPSEARTNYYQAPVRFQMSVSSKNFRTPTATIGTKNGVLVFSADETVCEVTDLQSQAVYPCKTTREISEDRSYGNIVFFDRAFIFANEGLEQLVRDFGVTDAALSFSDRLAVEVENDCEGQAVFDRMLQYFRTGGKNTFNLCGAAYAEIATATPAKSYRITIKLGPAVRY